MSTRVEPVMHRHFDVEQANALLPLVRSTFAEVRPKRAELAELAEKLEALGERPDLAAEHSHPPETQQRQRRIQELAHEIQVKLTALVELGIEVKSVDGLVDFRSHFCGRVVYLCWCWDEPEIACYHELTGGFSGRTPIESHHLFVGDLLH